jgi:SAM pointed domain-containing ETS transcription factor
LGYIDLNKFNFDGYYFCQLDEAGMKSLAPSLASGEILFSLLHMMNTRKGADIKQESRRDFESPAPPARQQPSPVSYGAPSPASSISGQNSFSGSSLVTPEVKYEQGSFWEPHAHSPAGSMGNDSGFGTEPISDDDERSEHSEHNFAITNGSHTHLWQFLKELLSKPALCGSAIRWVDRSKGIFKIEDSVRVAKLWGRRKNRPAMNYDKLSRSIRQYYKKGIMKKTERSQRLVYQFCAPYAV